MPEKYNALKIGTGNQESLKKVPLKVALDNDKASILIFCANWIEACKTINSDVQAALGEDAAKLNVVWIDADDPNNEPLLKEYGVKPLPAILYLTKSNELFQYTLGDPGPQAIRYRINQLLAHESKVLDGGNKNSAGAN
jgi:thiol-disulfide isomerase/thioredoxin